MSPAAADRLQGGRGPLLFALGMGLLGALLNLVPLPLGGSVDLVLGNCAYVLVANRLRARWALLAALLAVSPLYWSWGHGGGFLAFGLEACALAWLRGRGMPVFYADLIYWFVFGMPLTAVLMWLRGSPLVEVVVWTCMKQAFNGMVYSALAGVLALALAPWFAFGWRQQPVLRGTLRTRLVYAMVLVTALALSSSALLISRQMIRSQEALIRNGLTETADQLGRRLTDYVAAYRDSIGSLATALSLAGEPARERMFQSLLDAHRETWSGFVTMLAADRNGRIVAASPVERLASLDPSYRLSDRDYFRAAMARDGPFVSPVFRGRGFGNDPIVAISAAYHQNPGAERVGIVEGSLDLNLFSRLSDVTVDGSPVQVLLVDQDGRLVYSSAALGYEALSPLADHVMPRRGALGRTVLTLEVGERAVDFLHREVELDDGWRIHALLEYRVMMRSLGRQYYGIFLVVGGAILIAALLAARLGRQLSDPLEQLASDLAAGEQNGHTTLSPLRTDAANEIAMVHRELARNLGLVEAHRDELAAQVAERTRELEQANEMLQALASVDALTGLTNRRVMEQRFPILSASARRSGALLALVLVDLDHFKALNDTHGHLSGDRCLVRVGALLQQEFARDSDIVARFGGEEFVIAVACSSAGSLHAKLEHLRRQVETLALASDTGAPLRVSASFGAVVGDPAHSERLEDWVRLADACLYRAKDAGRNTIVLEERGS